MFGPHHITANIRFLSADEGGRTVSTPEKELRCIFTFQDRNYDCRLDLTEVGSLAPGNQGTVPIRFLFPDLIVDDLKTGDEFALRDYRLIATGTVLSVLNDETNNDEPTRA